MNTSLVNELADRLGTSTMEARIALADLLQDTRKELERHGAAELPGLGTFRREKRAASNLTFQPDVLLADAANHAFAGLDSLIVSEASAQINAPDDAVSAAPEPSAPEPLSENAVLPPLDEAPPLPPEARPEAESEPPAPPEHAAAEPRAVEPDDNVPPVSPSEEPAPDLPSVDEASPAAARLYEPDALEPDDKLAPDEQEPPDRPAPEPPAPLPIRKVDWESVLQDTPYAVMPAAGYLHGGPTRADLEAATLEAPALGAPTAQPTADRAPDRRAAPPRARRSSSLPRIAAALVLVTLAAGLLWYVTQPDERAEPPLSPTAERESPPEPSPAAGAAAGAASTSDTATAPPPSESDPAPAEETLAPVLDPAPGDWTAVAASRPSRAAADSLAQQYRAQFGPSGAPVGVIAGEVDGNQFFRVAVGRFSSFDETQAFLQRAGPPLPDDAWALQIEP